MKLRVPWLVRLLVSAGVLAALLVFVPLAQLWSAIRNVPLALWLGVLAAFLVGHAISALKWWWLTTPQTPVPLALALRAHFAGLLANLCLPGVAGGDLVRAGYLMRHAEGRTGIGVVCIADRLLDCVALLLLAGAGAVWTAQLGGLIRHALLGASAFLVLIALLAVAAYMRLQRRSSSGLGGRLAAALGILLQHPGLLLRSLLLALFVQGSFVGLNLCLGSAAGVEVSPGAWFVAWPLAKLVSTMPLSLAGLGVREAALVVFMQPFGAAPAAVTAAGLLWQALLATGGLVGGLIMLGPRGSTVVAPQEALVP
jgi:uncharacterized membrane protein YbhN (UPF0104 family)